nr:MAG TPA: hypothetical protein [Caudoviricetes sp.]
MVVHTSIANFTISPKNTRFHKYLTIMSSKIQQTSIEIQFVPCVIIMLAGVGE